MKSRGIKTRVYRSRGVCFDCRRPHPVRYEDWLGPTPPPCTNCNGPLVRQGEWRGTRKPKAVMSPDHIPPPTSETEFEVHARLYCGLLALGYAVRGDVSGDGGDRFDLVVFDKGVAVRIIEVKKRGVVAQRNQINRYSRYGVPVDVVCGMDEVDLYLKAADAAREKWFRD